MVKNNNLAVPYFQVLLSAEALLVLKLSVEVLEASKLLVVVLLVVLLSVLWVEKL